MLLVEVVAGIMQAMKVLVTSSTGLIGSALVKSLLAAGHDVGRLRRGQSFSDQPCWNPEKGIINLGAFADADAIVHLAGENIAGGRWTKQRKARILSSRVNGTKLLASTLAKLEHKPRVLISGSAIGYYGSRGAEMLDESGSSGTGFLADVCRRWEQAATPAVDAGIRVVNIRPGIVLSLLGGTLKKMLMPFRMGLGGVTGSGEQYMSWISIDDMVEAIRFIMENNSISGAVNLVSPNPVTNREFSRALGAVLRCPTFFAMLALLARIAFGQMADELLLSSACVMPRKLIESGYDFKHPVLSDALTHLFLRST